jgi:hypothetical protein
MSQRRFLLTVGTKLPIAMVGRQAILTRHSLSASDRRWRVFLCCVTYLAASRDLDCCRCYALLNGRTYRSCPFGSDGVRFEHAAQRGVPDALAAYFQTGMDQPRPGDAHWRLVAGEDASFIIRPCGFSMAGRNVSLKSFSSTFIATTRVPKATRYACQRPAASSA